MSDFQRCGLSALIRFGFMRENDLSRVQTPAQAGFVDGADGERGHAAILCPGGGCRHVSGIFRFPAEMGRSGRTEFGVLPVAEVAVYDELGERKVIFCWVRRWRSLTQPT